MPPSDTVSAARAIPSALARSSAVLIMAVRMPRRRCVGRTVTSVMKHAGVRRPPPVLIVCVVVANVPTGVWAPRLNSDAGA